ncbi:2'-5' RNA ligase family protein [Herbidospora mongoliensis]|uniref:2'-5' RNA ligase family protein n=1 Tax=Herbidospora mongoliensis TaxID=688067 RepID=UPI000AA7BB33|nr:2'-5' RNA ligase family protein [Herbidospora mongoliensis]
MSDEEQMVDHWWWRPGWRVGRRGYAWHLTFRDALGVHRLADVYRQALKEIAGLDPVPDMSLHLTMQHVGFTDEVPDEDMRAMVSAATRRLALLPAFEIVLDRPVITREAVRWDVTPAEPVAAVRLAVRQAIAEVWPQVRGRDEGFVPHISIAYSNAAVPYSTVAAALQAVDAPPACVRIENADLIHQHRDRRMYEWEESTPVWLANG